MRPSVKPGGAADVSTSRSSSAAIHSSTGPSKSVMNERIGDAEVAHAARGVHARVEPERLGRVAADRGVGPGRVHPVAQRRREHPVTHILDPMSEATLYQWRPDGLELIDHCDMFLTEVEAVDSWLVTEGRTLALDLHRSRFMTAIPRGRYRQTDPGAFWDAVIAMIPDDGDWFPRVELHSRLGGPRLLYRHRTAPERTKSVVVATWTDGDPRKHPDGEGAGPRAHAVHPHEGAAARRRGGGHPHRRRLRGRGRVQCAAVVARRHPVRSAEGLRPGRERHRGERARPSRPRSASRPSRRP